MGRADWGKVLTKPQQGGKGGKRHKYGAVATTTADGVWHPSSGQAKRWMFLQQCQMAGLIRDLKREVPFDLMVNGLKVCRYVADHTYTLAGELAQEARAAWLRDSGEGPLRLEVVEDFKGKMTAEARVKLSLFRAVEGYDVKIVKDPQEGFARR